MMNRRVFLLTGLALGGMACLSSKTAVGRPQVQTNPSAPPPFPLEELERHLHAGVNNARQTHGLGALDWSGSLAELARSHSQDMARHGYFSHTGRDGSTPTDRAQAQGIDCRIPVSNRRYQGLGENLAVSTAYVSYTSRTSATGTQITYNWHSARGLAEQTVQGWLNSPGHRKILLGSAYGAAGIGAAWAPEDKKIYMTQNFC